MKKFTLLIAALLLVSFGAFGLDVAPVAEFDGSASFTFGVNLEDSSTGINNASSADITITFYDAATEETSGDPVVGYIAIEFSVDITNEGSLTATAEVTDAELKLAPGISLVILGLDNEVNLASTGAGVNNGIQILTAKVTDISLDPTEEFQGIGLAMDLGVVTVDIGVASKFDWTGGEDGTVVAERGDNTANNYNFYAAVGLTAVENLTFGVAFTYEMVDSAWALGVEAGYDLGIVNTMVGFDFNDASDWELGVGVGLVLGEGVAEDLFVSDNDEIEGLTVGFGVDSASEMDLAFAFYDGALIPVLDLGVAVDLAGLSDFGLIVDASADLGVAMPYAVFQYTEAAMELEVGVELAVIEYTTFDVKYMTEDLGNHNGYITFMTEVAF